MTHPTEKTLTTLRLTLRPWREEDAADVYRFASDPAVGFAAGRLSHKSVEHSREIIREELSGAETYAVVLRYDMTDAENGSIIPAGTPVGSVGLTIQNGDAELDGWLCRPLQGRGLITEASLALIQRGFTDLGFHRIRGRFLEDNEAARRALQKCGFVIYDRKGIPPNPVNGATGEYVAYILRENWSYLRRQTVTHELHLREAPFRAIASGKKRVELRLCDSKRQRIRVGDEILFKLEWSTEAHIATVTDIHYFPHFEALYAALIPTLGAEALGYAEGEIPDPADMLAYYPAESIARYGVVGIEIALTSFIQR